MSDLTYSAYVSRNIIKFGGLIVIFFGVSYSLLVAGIQAYKKAHPPYIPPDIRYGKIAKIAFPVKSKTEKTFALELANDALPSFPTKQKVFVVYRPESPLMALELDTEVAKKMGFTGNPVEISTGVYRFYQAVTTKTLIMNVLDGSFSIKYPYEEDQLLLASNSLPDKNQATEIATTFLTTAGKYSEDLSQGTKEITYWKIVFDSITKVESYSQANAIRIDFFRKKLDDGYRIVSIEPGRSSVSVLVSASTVETKQIIELSYKYVPFDRESFGTYPVISAKAAWDKLVSGDYFPAQDTDASKVAINNVELAYFEPVTLSKYLQPIYIFSGKNFVAYVPAVDYDSIK